MNTDVALMSAFQMLTHVTTLLIVMMVVMKRLIVSYYFLNVFFILIKADVEIVV